MTHCLQLPATFATFLKRGSLNLQLRYFRKSVVLDLLKQFPEKIVSAIKRCTHPAFVTRSRLV